MTSLSLKARTLRHEIETSIVHAIASDLQVAPSVACTLRRLFLLERVCAEPLVVEVAGSAHHTHVGDHGAPDTDVEGAPVDLEEDPDDIPAVKQYIYLNDGVLAGITARLVAPVGEPFRRGRKSESIHRYLRLTPTGQAAADKYIRLESAAKARKPALASQPFAEQVREDKREGRLSLKPPEAP